MLPCQAVSRAGARACPRVARGGSVIVGPGSRAFLQERAGRPPGSPALLFLLADDGGTEARWTVDRPALRRGATRRGPCPPGSIGVHAAAHQAGTGRGPGASWSGLLLSSRGGWNVRRARTTAPAGWSTAA